MQNRGRRLYHPIRGGARELAGTMPPKQVDLFNTYINISIYSKKKINFTLKYYNFGYK